MSFANNTPFAGQAFPYMDPDGREIAVAVVKASYAIDARGKPCRLAEQIPVRPVDEPWDPDCTTSSVRLPGDLCDAKPGTDVVVVGDALSEKPVPVMDVGVSIGKRLMPLRVHGPRLFAKSAMGMKIGHAVPFQRQPIRYEHAFGGASEDLSHVELRNPSGVGISRHVADLDGRPAPQIEHPLRPHTSATDTHQPMGYGAIATHWTPRREYFGTIDQEWLETRSPIFPKDFSRRYYSVAHPSLWCEESLPAGIPVGVVGMSEERALSFELPELVIRYIARFDEGQKEAIARLDTLVIMPEQRQFEMTVRAAFPIGRKNRLREIGADLWQGVT